MTKKISFAINWPTIALAIFGLSFFILTPTVKAADCPTLGPGDLFKVPDNSAVYLVNSNMERMYFPNSAVYKTWYQDYSAVIEIPNTCVDNYPAPTSPPYGVNYRPGSKLVKVQISPSVYAVGPDNTKYKIGSEEVARALYGDNWAQNVVDIADVFWPNYVHTGNQIVEDVPHEGMLIRVQGGNIYRVQAGELYRVQGQVRNNADVHTVSQTVFDSLNDSGSEVTVNSLYADPAQMAQITSGQSSGSNQPIIIKAKDTVSQETGSVRLTEATGDSMNPSIAYNGQNFGLVWEDKREGGEGSDLFFALVDADGNKIVDDTQITNTPDKFSTNPEIVWDGSGFGIVYAEYTDSIATGQTVDFVRINTSGSLLGDVVELIDGVDRPNPSIAWNGEGYGIVFRTPNNQQGKQYFSFIKANGDVDRYPMKIIEDEGSNQTEVVWDGEMFAIVYRQSPEIIGYGDSLSYTVGTYLYRVDKNGNAEDAIQFIDGKEALAAIWNGSSYAAVEQDKTFSVFTRNAAMQVQNAAISSVGLTDSDLTYVAGVYGFVGVNDNAVYFSKAASDGTLRQTSNMLDEADSAVQSKPRIDTDGTSYIIVWSDDRDDNNGSEIYFEKVE